MLIDFLSEVYLIGGKKCDIDRDRFRDGIVTEYSKFLVQIVKNERFRKTRVKS